MSSETPDKILSTMVWALKELDVLFATMSSSIPAANFIDVDGAQCYRHEEYSDSLACFLKGVKVVSTLNAAATLIAFGYAQEVEILCRVADDCCSDIIFLALPEKEEGGQRKFQFITDFFQEEFANVKNPLDTRNKRQNIPRSKIHGAFSEAAKDFLNPSDGQKTQAALHGGLSGYVHGLPAYNGALWWLAASLPSERDAGVTNCRADPYSTSSDITPGHHGLRDNRL